MIDLTKASKEAMDEARSAMVLAAHHGDLDTLRELLDAGLDVNTTDVFGVSALEKAVKSGCAEAVGLLCARGARFESPWHQPALCLAAEGLNIDCLRTLIDAGADIEVRHQDGFTPFLSAVRTRNVDAAALLIARGCDIEAQSKTGWSALKLALRNSDWAMAKLLVDKGANVNAVAHDQSVLFGEVVGGRAQAAMFLIAHGADVNFASLDGLTVLMIACERGEPELVRALLSAGANPNVISASDETALGLAASRGRTDVCVALIEAGADTDPLSLKPDTDLYRKLSPVIDAIRLKSSARLAREGDGLGL